MGFIKYGQHKCDVPALSPKPGTIWQCDMCLKFWKRVKTTYEGENVRYWKPLRFQRRALKLYRR